MSKQDTAQQDGRSMDAAPVEDFSFSFTPVSREKAEEGRKKKSMSNDARSFSRSTRPLFTLQVRIVLRSLGTLFRRSFRKRSR
jgi:hypothetical protein